MAKDVFKHNKAIVDSLSKFIVGDNRDAYYLVKEATVLLERAEELVSLDNCAYKPIKAQKEYSKGGRVK